MRPMKKPRMVVFSPHTHDGEFGCGGTLVRGCDNRYIRALALTRGVQIGVDRAESYGVML